MFGQSVLLQPIARRQNFDLRSHTKFYKQKRGKCWVSLLPFRNHKNTGGEKMVTCQRRPAVSVGGSVICAVKTVCFTFFIPFTVTHVCSTADVFVFFLLFLYASIMSSLNSGLPISHIQVQTANDLIFIANLLTTHCAHKFHRNRPTCIFIFL